MSKFPNPVRRKLGQALRKSAAMREADKRIARAEARDDATQRQLVRQQQQLDRAAKQEQTLRAALDKQAKQVESLTKSLAALREQVRPFERAHGIRELDHLRLTSQVEALERRVADHDVQRGDAPLVSDDPASARSLIDEIRREHEQIRTRLQVISWYEERLRRVEESVTALYDGDVRHPV